jgi:hypothetical protein
MVGFGARNADAGCGRSARPRCFSAAKCVVCPGAVQNEARTLCFINYSLRNKLCAVRGCVRALKPTAALLSKLRWGRCAARPVSSGLNVVSQVCWRSGAQYASRRCGKVESYLACRASRCVRWAGVLLPLEASAGCEMAYAFTPILKQTFLNQ